MESVKRSVGGLVDPRFFPDSDLSSLIVGLLLLDAWYSSGMFVAPIITPGSVEFILPYDDALFEATTSAQWVPLIDGERHLLMPTVLAPSGSIEVPMLRDPVNGLCMYGVLALVQLQQSEAYHRLVRNRASRPFVPCYVYAMDDQASCLPSLQSQIAHKYGDVFERLDPNIAIMWHSMCMALTADLQLFCRVATTDAPAPRRRIALRRIQAWSQTPAARQACLHAAHIYKATDKAIDEAIANDKDAKPLLFYSEASFFCAALVLALYQFTVPEPKVPPAGRTSIELLDDLQWQTLATECFTGLLDPEPSDNLTVNFIRDGGTVSMQGVPLFGDCLSARLVLKKFERLLEKSTKWNMGNFSRGLRLFHDDLLGTKLLFWDMEVID